MVAMVRPTKYRINQCHRDSRRRHRRAAGGGDGKNQIIGDVARNNHLIFADTGRRGLAGRGRGVSVGYRHAVNRGRDDGVAQLHRLGDQDRAAATQRGAGDVILLHRDELVNLNPGGRPAAATHHHPDQMRAARHRLQRAAHRRCAVLDHLADQHHGQRRGRDEFGVGQPHAAAGVFPAAPAAVADGGGGYSVITRLLPLSSITR